METTKTKIKKWGNSLGIIIPNDISNKQNLKEGITVRVNIQTEDKTKAGDIFGILKGKLGDTEDLMNEVDKDLWDK